MSGSSLSCGSLGRLVGVGGVGGVSFGGNGVRHHFQAQSSGSDKALVLKEYLIKMFYTGGSKKKSSVRTSIKDAAANTAKRQQTQQQLYKNQPVNPLHMQQSRNGTGSSYSGFFSRFTKFGKDTNTFGNSLFQRFGLSNSGGNSIAYGYSHGYGYGNSLFQQLQNQFGRFAHQYNQQYLRHTLLNINNANASHLVRRAFASRTVMTATGIMAGLYLSTRSSSCQAKSISSIQLHNQQQNHHHYQQQQSQKHFAMKHTQPLAPFTDSEFVQDDNNNNNTTGAIKEFVVIQGDADSKSNSINSYNLNNNNSICRNKNEKRDSGLSEITGLHRTAVNVAPKAQTNKQHRQLNQQVAVLRMEKRYLSQKHTQLQSNVSDIVYGYETSIKHCVDVIDGLNKDLQSKFEIIQCKEDKIGEMTVGFKLEMDCMKTDYEKKLNHLQEQLYQMECEQRCCVCLTNNRNIIYQCGHRVVCDECDVTIANRSNTCAICRADVTSRVQHF